MNENSNELHGSGHTVSMWMGARMPDFEPLDHNLDVDVCVIGAGIAGLSAAYHLAGVSKSVVVLEDGTIGSGETSRTTAHLTNAFDDRYLEIEKLHGGEGAWLTAHSHTAAIDSIEQIVIDEGIECDFERLPGYLFAPPGDSPDELEHERQACHSAGLTEVEWVDQAPIAGFQTGRCLRFPRQAQIHPMRYLAGLALGVVKRGGKIHTSTHATRVVGGKDGGSARVETGEGGFVVTAREVIVATNTPVQDLLTIHTKQYPYRTYVIAARIPRGSVVHALYWDTLHPYHYARVHRAVDDELLIVGGEDHKTGQNPAGVDPFVELERWARERFPMMGEIEHHWSGQVMEPMDALGYIGRNPGDENVWVVTGDSGNGMTHGALAGLLLRDLIEGREQPWAKLYDPSRKSLRAAPQFIRENLNMAAQYARWLTAGDVKNENEIAPGSGGVVREGRKLIAVWRDPRGQLHRFHPVCPHLGAIVGWNAGEGTWDCPAHGSRFDATGRVVNGPANADLKPADERSEAKKEDHAA